MRVYICLAYRWGKLESSRSYCKFVLAPLYQLYVLAAGSLFWYYTALNNTLTQECLTLSYITSTAIHTPIDYDPILIVFAVSGEEKWEKDYQVRIIL